MVRPSYTHTGKINNIIILDHICERSKDMADVPDTFLSSLPPDFLVVLSAFISIAFAEVLSINDLNVLGNLTTAISGGLLTIAAQEQLLREKSQQAATTQADSSDSSNGSNGDKDIQDMKKQIEELQKQVKKLNSHSR